MTRRTANSNESTSPSSNVRPTSMALDEIAGPGTASGHDRLAGSDRIEHDPGRPGTEDVQAVRHQDHVGTADQRCVLQVREVLLDQSSTDAVIAARMRRVSPHCRLAGGRFGRQSDGAGMQRVSKPFGELDEQRESPWPTAPARGRRDEPADRITSRPGLPQSDRFGDHHHRPQEG